MSAHPAGFANGGAFGHISDNDVSRHDRNARPALGRFFMAKISNYVNKM
jgi:hypothetical protein